jgi:dienelactone hydrolase
MKKLVTLLIAFICTSAYSWSFYSWSKTDNGVPVMVVKNGTSGDNPNNGTVLLLHGCSGPNTIYENFAGLLAGENFNAVIIDSWAYRNMPTGHGSNSVCSTYSVTGRDRLQEVYKVVDWLKSQPWHKGNIYIVGWSHGGMTALAASKDGPKLGVTKSVAFYPYCLPGHFTNPTIPTQIHIGKDDDWTPAYLCRNIYNGFFSKSDKGEVFEYENSYHGFDGSYNVTVQGLGEHGRIQTRIIRPNQDAKKLSYERVFKFLKDQ